MKAIVVGATGATGKDLVDVLLGDEEYSSVEIFVRRNPNLEHEKLKVHIIDFDQSEEWANLVQGDVLFSWLGTTLKAAGSKEAQWKIDYDYQYEFAAIAKRNGVSNYVLISSAMANANSSFYYMRMKGELEEAVKKLNFERSLIFNPPALVRENSDRAGENFGVKLVRILNFFGIAKNQKPLPTKVLAQSMVNALKTSGKGIHHFQPKDIGRTE